ncbi:MAG: FtsX-like permease family protein [Treponema sp.]|nr:FtsX-like permease family protein [Treponema sp.]
MFISFSIAMMILANAIFDGTGTGIQSSFIASFTGDIVVRPKVDYPLSLFGDETPATGDFSEIPNIEHYSSVSEFVASIPEIEKTASQISHPVMLNFDGEHTSTIFFGVDFDNYLSVMDGIRIIDSIPYSKENDKNCIMMSKNFLDFLEQDVYAKVKLGDMIQIIAKTPMSYNIRSAKLVAIYEYKSQNAVLDKISLVNSELLLDLMGKADSSEPIEEIGEEYQNLLDSDFDLDSLFGDNESVAESGGDVFSSGNDGSAAEAVKAAAPETDGEPYWHYIICRVKDGSSKLTKLVILKMNKYFSDNNLPMEAVNWRTAAGLSAQYLYWIRLVFNIGIFIILVTGFIVVNSTLTISSIDRIRETGTMRAIGASRNFIASQYLFETMILTFVSGILGCILGAFFVRILNMVSITFTNSYLIQLFGGTKLVTSISFGNIRQCFFLIVLLTLWGWFYPVRIALGTSPVKAMQGGS